MRFRGFPHCAWIVLGLVALGLAAEPQQLRSDPERPQRDVAVTAAQAAWECRILAEEMEINFGVEKAADPARTVGILGQVADKDVPAVIEDMTKLRLSADTDARQVRAAIDAGQTAILGKLRAVMRPSSGGLAMEELKEKAKAVAEAQSKMKKVSSQLAAATIGKSNDALTARERSALDDARDAQSNVASEAAALDQAARKAALGDATDPASADRISRAIESSRLQEAKRDAQSAAEAIAQNELGRALEDEDSALRKLEAFRDALDGDAPQGTLAEQLSALAADERKLAAETGQSPRPLVQELASKQEENRRSSGNLMSRMPDGSIARPYAAAASEEMANASQELSQASSENGKSADEAYSKASDSQRKAADYLDAAKKALEDATVSQLEDKMREASADLESAEERVEALDDLIKDQKDLKNRIEATQPRSEGLQRMAAKQKGQKDSKNRAEDAQPRSEGLLQMAAEQEALRKSAMQMASQAKTEANQQSNGQKSSQREHAKQTGEKLSQAANAMKSASDALSRSKGRMAADNQEKATSSLEEVRQTQAQAAAAAAKELMQLAATMGKAAPAPMPQGLKSSLSLMAAGKGTQPGPSKSKEKGQTAKSGQAPSDSNGSSATGLRGLLPGSGGSLGAEAAAVAAWQAKLPHGTPPEIVQSAHGVFPKGYEEALRRYYETIARQ